VDAKSRVCRGARDRVGAAYSIRYNLDTESTCAQSLSTRREIGPLLPGGGANLRTFAMLGGGGLTPLAKSPPL